MQEEQKLDLQSASSFPWWPLGIIVAKNDSISSSSSFIKEISYKIYKIVDMTRFTAFKDLGCHHNVKSETSKRLVITRK